MTKTNFGIWSDCIQSKTPGALDCQKHARKGFFDSREDFVGHPSILLLQVTPVVLESELQNVPVTTRKCLYSYEMGVLPRKMSLAKSNESLSVERNTTRTPRLANYSRSGCYYECMLEGASVASHCTPWLFPPSWSDSKYMLEYKIPLSKLKR